nr:TrkA C-terminal domain-containing protein [Phytoactinopolyspora mesophila]
MQAEGVLTEQFPIPAGSPFAGRPLRDTAARRHTGTSIVAVLRQQNVTASPGPEFVFEAGDIVVAVGTRDGLDQLAQLLTDGPA